MMKLVPPIWIIIQGRSGSEEHLTGEGGAIYIVCVIQGVFMHERQSRSPREMRAEFQGRAFDDESPPPPSNSPLIRGLLLVDSRRNSKLRSSRTVRKKKLWVAEIYEKNVSKVDGTTESSNSLPGSR